MKKVCLILFALFAPAVVCGAVKYYSDTEQKYYFEPDVLSSQLELFVPKEETRVACAELYTSLMNQENGQVSVTDLFAVCRKAGFNTYRKDGFDKCREFVSGLLAADELGEFMTGYCPGLDENGKNPNALKSITDQTQIGDFCSSTNIAGGEVVFRKGYNCTCAAYACNPGFQSEKGACVTEYKDANGDCLRKEYTNITNIKAGEGALQFCESNAIKGCKVRNAIKNFGGVKGRIVCNATRDELDSAKQMIFDQKEKRIAGMKYYEVCGKDKGKSGGTEFCVEKVFNWVNVGQVEAVALAQEYVKARYGHARDIVCANSYRTSYNDDYIKCATLDQKYFYEFQFDDVTESSDKNFGLFGADKLQGVVQGLAIIYNGQVVADEQYSLVGDCGSSVNKKIVDSAKKFGLKAHSSGGWCTFGYDTIKDDSELASIEGLDNRIFYNDIQVQGSGQIEEYLKKYIRNQGIAIRSFSCESGYKKLKTGFLKPTDDVWRCYLNGQPIDWVFDDLSELGTERREAGHAGMNCIISGGLYAGQKCHGLSNKQCTEMNAQLKKINPKSSGTVWQNGQCVLRDAQEQQYIEDGIQVGLSVISLADCATVIIGNAQGVMGCTLAVVEITGFVTEMTTGAAMQERADEFLKTSVTCKQRSCAVKTIKTMAAKVVSVKDALKSSSTMQSVDSELARLIGLLEPEDLQQECSGDCDYEQLITALGGDPEDMSGKALVVANKVGFIAQFASLGASAFRLTGKALAKLGFKATKAVDTASDVARLVSRADDVADASRLLGAADDVTDASRLLGAADDVTDAAKVASKADDVADASRLLGAADAADDAARAADNAADAARGARAAAGQADDAARGATGGARAAGQADDAARGATNGARAAGQADDAARGATNGAKAAGQADDAARGATGGARAAGQADDAARGAANGARTAEKTQEIVYDMAYFSKNASGTDDVFKSADDLVQINRQNMSANVIRDLMKKAKQYGFACIDCGGDILKFSKSVDEAADAARAADNVSDAARGAARGARAAGQAEDVAGAADRASDAARLVSRADDVADAADDAARAADNAADAARGATNGAKAAGQADDAARGATTGAKAAGQVEDVAGAAKVANDAGMFNASVIADGFKGRVGKYEVFLEKLPTADGGASELVDIGGRAVAVVNVDGHRIPFYVSSGQAGKDALGIPSGKWYPIAGIGNEGHGWFNKMPDMNNNPVRELDEIANRLAKQLDPQTLKQYALNGRIPEADYSGASRIINSEFSKGVVPELKLGTQRGVGYMDPKYRPLFEANIQHIMDIFR